MLLFTRSIIVIGNLLFCLALVGQNQVIDSLRLELAAAKNDTSIIKLSTSLALQLSSSNPDSARLLCQQAGALIPELDSAESKVMAFLQVGIGYRGLGQLDTALFYLEQGKALAQKIDSRTGLGFIYNTMGNVYRSQDESDQALKLYEQALAIHRERKGEENEQAAVINNLAVIFMEKGKYEQAITYYEEALQIQEQIHNRLFVGIIYHNLALCHRRMKRQEKALVFYQKAQEIFQELGEKQKEALLLTLMSYIYRDQGDFLRSIALNQKALDLRKEIGDKKGIASSLSNLGMVYKTLGEFPKSLSYYEESLDTFLALGEKRSQAMVLNNLGDVARQMEDFDIALGNLHRSIELKKEVGPERTLNAPLYNLGSTYLKMNKLDSAYIYLQQALGVSDRFQDVKFQRFCLTALGEVYRQRSEYDKALATLEQARGLAELGLYQENDRDIFIGLYQLYKDQGNYPRALQNLELFNSVEDSLFNKESTQAITRLEANYEFEQQKQQLAHNQEKELLEKDTLLRRRRLVQIFTGFALLAALVFIVVIARFYQSKRQANVRLIQLNEEVTSQKEELEQLNAFKSRFFTNISHELRTPLTIIGGMARQIKQSPKEWLQKGISIIERNNANLLDLVNQILDLRKVETGAMPVNLVQGDVIPYLKFILESFQSLGSGKGVQLHFLSKEKELNIDYDKEKYLRIFSNLLSNAIKFTPERGNVYFSIEVLAQGEKPTSTDETESAKMLEITVKDTGVGIPKEKLPYIFDRFYQVDSTTTRQGEGTGIGLALTYELVKLLKGTLAVDSQVDAGTTFIITLPITRQAVVEEKVVLDQSISNDQPGLEEAILIKTPMVETSVTKQAVPPLGAYGQENARLLIIEDNPDLVIYLESLLEGQFEILIARDGQEGIEMALEHIPDLIISDVMMPKKDGFEVCQTLKQDVRSSHIPIVLLTAKATVDSRIEGIERGADAYLAKPFDERELFVRLKKLVELRQQLQQRYQRIEGGPGQASASSSGSPYGIEDAFMAKLQAVVEENLDDGNFGPTQLCKAMGMSRSHLHQKIKALTNLSTSIFIRTIRLHRAKDLLQAGELNVTQIAFEVGFNDLSYFSRKFSEEFGVSPQKAAQL